MRRPAVENVFETKAAGDAWRRSYKTAIASEHNAVAMWVWQQHLENCAPCPCDLN